MRRARPTGPVPVGGPPDSQIAWAKTYVTAGQAGQPEEALIPRVHDQGHAVPLGQDGEDDLLGPGHA